MGLLHHWEDEDGKSFEELRDEYVRDIENDCMASLNEILNVYRNVDYLSAEEFCTKYGLK